MRRRPVLGAFSGFFLGLFLAVDLVFLGFVPLDSVIITLLPIIGLVVGIAVGFRPRPIRRHRAAI